MTASLDENVEEEAVGSSSSASVVGEEEEELRSANSAEEVAQGDSSPLAGIEDRVLITTQILLFILTPITLTTTTPITPAPTAASTTAVINIDTNLHPSISGSAEYTEGSDPAAASSIFPFEDVDDITLNSYANELLEESNLFDLPLSSDINATTTTTTTAAPEVKTEVEEPDWNDVY